MRTPEPLRNNPFRYRRRRSLHSKLYGEDHSDPIRPINNVSRYRGTPSRTGPISPKSYMSGFSEQYVPHPGFMQMPQGTYQTYDEFNMSISDFGGTSNEFRSTAMKLAGIKPPDGGVEYDDCLMTEEVFLQQIESLREQFPPDFDTNEIASQILAAQSQDEEIVMEQNLYSDMLEIQIAVEQARDEPLAEPNPASSDFGLAIPQDFFEQQEQMFEGQLYEMQQFAELDYGAQMETDFSAQQAMFEQPIEEMGPSADLRPQPLEDIIEAERMQYEGGMLDDMADMPGYDSCPMTQELFEEQMHDATEEMEPMVLHPDQLQYDNGMMQQEMYDEQMQEMMDPFMMPGPFGPMSFGPGPSGGP